MHKNTGITITDQGELHLAEVIGTESLREQFIKNQVVGWVKDLQLLSKCTGWSSSSIFNIQQWNVVQIDPFLTLWRLAGFGDLRKKYRNTWLCVGISPVSPTDLVKGSKDMASLLVCTRKKIFAWGCGFFVSAVISGVLSGHLGSLYLALGTNH